MTNAISLNFKVGSAPEIPTKLYWRRRKKMSSAKVAAAIGKIGDDLNSEVERVVGVVNKLKAENEELRAANAMLRGNRAEREWLRERLSDWDVISADLAREIVRMTQLQDRAARECSKIRTRIDMLEEK